MKRYKDIVGKSIGGCVYFHHNYLNEMLGVLNIDPKNRMCLLPGMFNTLAAHPNFKFNIVKYNPKKQTFTFINSPDFDTANEPVIAEYVRINYTNALTKYFPPKKKPQIYHHKWMFVKDDYTGFDVAAAKQRSEHIDQFMKKWKINRSKIGSQEYWNTLNI